MSQRRIKPTHDEFQIKKLLSRTISMLHDCFYRQFTPANGKVIPRRFVTLLCAFAASSNENVCAISASVRTRSIALLNSLIASSVSPLQKYEKVWNWSKSCICCEGKIKKYHGKNKIAHRGNSGKNLIKMLPEARINSEQIILMICQTMINT